MIPGSLTLELDHTRLSREQKHELLQLLQTSDVVSSYDVSAHYYHVRLELTLDLFTFAELILSLRKIVPLGDHNEHSGHSDHDET